METVDQRLERLERELRALTALALLATARQQAAQAGTATLFGLGKDEEEEWQRALREQLLPMTTEAALRHLAKLRERYGLPADQPDWWDEIDWDSVPQV